jgi:hypothetical protein
VLPHHSSAWWVESCRGFIHENEFGGANERTRESYALFLATRHPPKCGFPQALNIQGLDKRLGCAPNPSKSRNVSHDVRPVSLGGDAAFLQHYTGSQSGLQTSRILA